MSRFVRWLLVVTIGLVILCCMGLLAPVDFFVAVTFGWIWYLARTIPEIQIARSGLATAAVCLILLVVGLQYFLGWLYRELRNPDSDPKAGDSRWKWRWTLGLVAGVILLFSAGTATVGVTHQLGWLISSRELLFVSDLGGARNAARRAWSMNNLKQIGLGLEQYEQAHQMYPPGGTFDRIGRPLQSWQTLILPYVDEEAVYERINLASSWNDVRNSRVFQTEIMAYLNPGISERKNGAGFAASHYAANVDMLGGDHPRTIADVADGTAFTLMAGEVVSNFKSWGDPTNWRDPRLGLNRSPEGFGSPFPGGASFLFVDGSVRFIKNAVDPQVLKAIATPSGHEKVGTNQY
jgi:prepilin-type processing-associated H-X9-DG protein